MTTTTVAWGILKSTLSYGQIVSGIPTSTCFGRANRLGHSEIYMSRMSNLLGVLDKLHVPFEQIVTSTLLALLPF